MAQAEKKTSEDLFVHFRSIVNVYIAAGSKLEINIGTSMRNKVLEVGITVILSSFQCA